MASPSSPLKNAETLAVEAVAKLLRNGSQHDADRPEIAHAVEHLRSLGLVDTTIAEYVRCADSRDRDYQYVRDRSCRGRIRLNAALDEDGDSFHCPECGRTVYPHNKARHKMLHVEVKPDKVAAFLDGVIEKRDLPRKQVQPWVWRVDMPQGEAKLVVVDYCSQEHVSRDLAVNTRVCYIVVDSANCKNRFLPEKWLSWSRLADVVCQPGMLVKLLSSAAETAPSPEVRVSVPVYSATVRPVVLGGSPQKAGSVEETQSRPQETRPDPQVHTTAKFWTKKDGTFCLSTKTQGREDGKAEFQLRNGAPTKQMQLMKILCFKHPNELALAELMDQVYPESKGKIRMDGAALADLLKTLRTLISDIRNKKLSPAGINPEILPALDVEVTTKTTVTFRLAHMHDLDAAGCDDRTRDST